MQQKLQRHCQKTGSNYLKVNPAGTSITCYGCGHRDRKNRKTQGLFHCLRYLIAVNADENAARNIRRRGHEMTFTLFEHQLTLLPNNGQGRQQSPPVPLLTQSKYRPRRHPPMRANLLPGYRPEEDELCAMLVRCYESDTRVKLEEIRSDPARAMRDTTPKRPAQVTVTPQTPPIAIQQPAPQPPVIMTPTTQRHSGNQGCAP